MEEITIIIQDKRMYSGGAESHPDGDFYADNIKYTCWDSCLFKMFQVGDEVKVSYTEKSNSYKGKTYVNKNISKMDYVSATDNQNSEDEKIGNIPINTNLIDSKSTHIEIGGLKYEVTLRLIE